VKKILVNLGCKELSFEKSYGALQNNYSILLNRMKFCSLCMFVLMNGKYLIFKAFVRIASDF